MVYKLILINLVEFSLKHRLAALNYSFNIQNLLFKAIFFIY